jgi:hypothetical protein
MESHVPRKLDAEMPKAANALHRDQVSTAQAGVAKSVVGGDTRAQQGCGFCGCELIGNRTDGACFGDHHFRLSSVRAHAQYHRVLAVNNVSAPARFAHPVFSGNEADTNPLTHFPAGHACTQGFNAADHFMPRNTRQSQTRVRARDRGRIGVTDSACFHPNPNLTRSGLGDRPFHYSKRAGLIYFDCFVCAFHWIVLPIFTLHS